jgi:hypothetical protein
MAPRAEYLARLDARRATRDRLDRADARMSNARLVTFLSALLVAFVVWRAAAAIWWVLVPAAIFAWLLYRHDWILRERAAAARAMAFYERGLARLDDRWTGTGEPGDRFRRDDHPYANDLDLFGRGSLFELLSLARTRTGEETLAAWLTAPADIGEIEARQEAVTDLTPKLDLREELALAGADVRAAVHTDRLLEWARSPMTRVGVLGSCTWGLTAAALSTIVYAAATGVLWPLGAVVVLEAAVLWRLRHQVEEVVSGHAHEGAFDFVGDALTHRAADLDVVAGLLKHLEQQEFVSRRLVSLRGNLMDSGVPASRIIRRLHRLSGIRDSAGTMTLLPLGLLLIGQMLPDFMMFLTGLALATAAVLQLASPHIALAVVRWRRQHGGHVHVWLQTMADFEALSSLSGYRFEHPDDPFPIVLPPDTARPKALFAGKELGHPLLPAATMVRNDVHLADGAQLLVVSGSNMSGKSTLLRTVGINAVLALAGAPVRAASLRISPLAVGATLRIQDSLQEGRSRFYAEITRLRELVDIASGRVPLLFLLDELLHGTNSHDRLVGAAGVLRGLVDRGAAGLVTTHDLALTAVADELSPRAANVHFEDWFEGDDIRFDYRVKSGPVTRSNALALMRAVGLEVGTKVTK